MLCYQSDNNVKISIRTRNKINIIWISKQKGDISLKFIKMIFFTMILFISKSPFLIVTVLKLKNVYSNLKRTLHYLVRNLNLQKFIRNKQELTFSDPKEWGQNNNVTSPLFELKGRNTLGSTFLFSLSGVKDAEWKWKFKLNKLLRLYIQGT